MKKKTKKSSYKNAIAIAVASFASIALISTGLAAFVIIKDSTADTGGNISVENVVDTDLELAITKAPGDIVFDAEKNDFEGRVQVDSAEKGAVLIQTIEGTIKMKAGGNLKDKAKLTYTFNIKDRVVNGSVKNTEFTNTFLKEVGGKTRIDLLPGLALGGEPANLDINVPDASAPHLGTFVLTVGFKWGSKYNGINPSLYYDTEAGLKAATDDQVSTDLTELYGLEHSTYKFEVALKASSKK